MLSPSRTTSVRRWDPTVLGTAKPTHRKSSLWPTMRGRYVSKRIMKEFTIASWKIQRIVIRSSKIGWTEEKCIRDGQIGTGKPLLPPILWGMWEISENWYISLNKSGKNASMKLRSDFRTAVTKTNRLHRESGEPFPFHQFHRWHSSSSSSSSWWQWNQNWWSSYFLICCSRIVYGWWQSAATDGVVNSTPDTSLFSRVCAHL